MALLEFDKLNTIELVQIPEERKRSMSYDKYFGEMYLTEEEIEARKQTAVLLEEQIRNFLLLLLTGMVIGTAMYDAAREELINNLQALNLGNAAYREALANNLIRSTMEHEKNDWYYSEDRVIFDAENEANTLQNGNDFARAVMRGMTRKQWKGIGDKKERKTHLQMNDKIIPINEYFTVGNAKCLYPKDILSPYTTLPDHPKELIRCRCSCKYLK